MIQTTLKTWRNLATIATIVVFALATLLSFAPLASAHQDPGICESNSVNLSLTALRSDMSTVIIGGATVQSGEQIFYRATLNEPVGANCSFGGGPNGEITITTPDGITHQVVTPGNVPHVTAGSPFTAPLQSYTVSEVNVTAGVLTASASYLNGIAHTGGDTDFDPAGHDTASATVDRNVDYQDVALEVSKTAVPAAEETYEWTIDKSVSPETWDLFSGDSGTSEYTINLTKSLVGTTYSVSGVISIHNPAEFATAHVTDVSDTISGLSDVTVTCPGGLSFDVGPGATIECTYSFDLPDNAARTNTATVTTDSDVDGGEGNADFNPALVDPTVVGGSVDVDDTFDAGDKTGITETGSYTYTRPFACGAGDGEFQGTGNVVDNTATIVGTQISDGASVTVNCYDLTVTKDAETTFDRQYVWDVDKDVDATEIVKVQEGQQYVLNYTITASVIDEADSNWAVSGGITITNNHPSREAELTAVIDELTGALNAPVNCPALVVPAAGSIDCTYSTDLPDGTDRTNTATATQQNYDYDKDGVGSPSGTTDHSGNTDVAFGAPTTEIDEEVDLTDTFDGFAGGTVTVDESPKVFEYSREVSFEGDDACGEHSVDNTATIITNDTGTEDSDSVSVPFVVNCFEGCTLTQGYWKTHSAQGPAPYDEDGWGVLEDEEQTLLGDTNMTWLEVFQTPPKGNAWYQLAHQYMAAKLNVLNDADPADIDGLLEEAETLLTQENLEALAVKGKNANKQLKKQFVDLAGTLGSFNEGLIGPGHCDEDDTSDEE